MVKIINKQKLSVAKIKPLEGKEAEKFWKALKESEVRKEAVEKSKKHQ